jgi:type I restriction enzyme, S subunit
MIKYDKYKSSEINWLGDIPNEWEVKRVKDLADYQSGNYIDAMEFDNEAPYPVYGGNGIRGNCNKYNHFGDYILIGRQGALCGNINYAKDYFWATEHAVVVYKKKNINITWLGELLRVMNLNQYALSAAQPGLSVEKIKRLELPFVPFKTQNLIADFINTKTQAIDKKINLLTQKANYYKEYRKSLINETVCKGLDKNVKTKITELGFNVNDNYSFFRLKDLGYLYSGLSGKAGEDFNQDENPNNKGFIPFTNIANNTYLKKDHLGTVVVYDNENQNKVKKADIFFLMSSEGYEDIGKSAILDDELEETYLNSFCKGYRIKNRKANPYFLNYLLLSDNYRKQLTVEGKGFTRINLKMEKVNDFIVFIPNTIDEQKKIVSYLDDKTQTIDKIVSNINKQIQTLKELRKTLINDAVTGKIKVKND